MEAKTVIIDPKAIAKKHTCLLALTEQQREILATESNSELEYMNQAAILLAEKAAGTPGFHDWCRLANCYAKMAGKMK